MFHAPPGADDTAVWAGAILTALSRRAAGLAEAGRIHPQTALRLSGQALHPDARPASWLPALDGSAIRLVRRLLRAVVPSPLLRAEVETLLRHCWQVELLHAQEFAPEALLEAAGVLALGPAAALLRHYPLWDPHLRAARQETAELLSLFAAEAGCEGPCFSPLISEEALEPWLKEPQDRARLINTMRMFRLQNGLMEPWKADAFLPKLARVRSRGVLYFTIGAPLTTEQAIPMVTTDVVIRAQDIRKVRHPAFRRRQLVERVQGALAKGYRVLCAANHSTQESRRELVRAARALGAPVVALYCDWPEESLEPLLAQAESPPLRRTLNRVLETLEPPRAHEADEVLVLGPDGVQARWTADGTVSGGFTEHLEGVQAPEAEALSSAGSRSDPGVLLEGYLGPVEDVLLSELSAALCSESHARPPALLRAAWALSGPASIGLLEHSEALLDPDDYPASDAEGPASDDSDEY